MKTLSTALINEKNKLHSGNAWIVLLEITLTDAGSTVIRLANNTEDVLYGGETYTRFSFDLGVVESDVTGAIPAVKLKVANVSRLLTQHLNDLDGGMGSTVKVIVINSGHLTESYSWAELEFTVLACESNDKFITWTLGMANPKIQRFPLYRFLAVHCSWASNFKGAECGYVGAETTCDGTFNQCVIYNNTGRYGGFLGMQSDGIRIA